MTTPKVWSAYAVKRTLAEPLALAEEARLAGKRFLIWHTGDLNPIVPSSDWLVLVNALYRSERRQGWLVAPRFIDDPLGVYSDGAVAPSQRGQSPRVGFCGYASSSSIKLAYSVLQNLEFRAMYHAGRKMYEPPPLIPATLLRAKVLRALERHAGIATDFIIRTRYKTGSVQEFYRNIFETDYTVCVRGYGNWSVRLYETLACGRIPIFIDTDCALPFDDTVDWRHYCVWVPEGDASRAGDYVREFHESLSPTDLRARQRECRILWETRLSLNGFLSHLSENLAKSLPNSHSEP
ncbi:MAG TPA: exostosin family protein [Gemmatimonadaceae bacterium]